MKRAMSYPNQQIDGQGTKLARLRPPDDEKEGGHNSKSSSSLSLPHYSSAFDAAFSSSSEQSLSSSNVETTTAAAASTCRTSDSDAALSFNDRNDRKVSLKRSRTQEENDNSSSSTGNSSSSTDSCCFTESSPSSSSLQENGRRIIIHPRRNDILCGRGPGFYYHSGNIAFREFVQERKAEYNSAARRIEKTKITNEILERLGQLDPPARFLERTVNKQWVEIDSEKRFTKTSQALREGAHTNRVKKAKTTVLENESSDGKTTFDMDVNILQPRILRDAFGLGESETPVGDLTPAQLKAQSERIMNEVNGVLLRRDNICNAPRSSHTDEVVFGHVVQPAQTLPPFHTQVMQASASAQWLTQSNHNRVNESLMTSFNASQPTSTGPKDVAEGSQVQVASRMNIRIPPPSMLSSSGHLHRSGLGKSLLEPKDEFDAFSGEE